VRGGLAKHDERLVRRRWALLVVLAVGLAGGILAAVLLRGPMFVWFTFADCAGNRWQSGLLDETGSKRPAYAAFGAAVRALAVRPALSGGSGGGG
jgi:hypothetical protein